MVMGGMAIVRPALNVLGFNSGNVSLSTMSSFSPFSWTCLQREEKRKRKLQRKTGSCRKIYGTKMRQFDEVFYSKSGSLHAPPVFKGYDSVNCTLGGAVVTKL